MADRNCLSTWFPRLAQAGLPVPRTKVIHVSDGHELAHLLDGKMPHQFDPLVEAIRAAADEMGGYPVFLRTGQGSGKHDWKNTCHVPDAESVPNHVAALVEWSHLMDMMGLPHDVWCVREMLPVEPAAVLPNYGDMPLVKEVRCFIRGGKILCAHHYWPHGAVAVGFGIHRDSHDGRVKGSADVIRVSAAMRAIDLTPEDYRRWRPLAEQVAALFADAFHKRSVDPVYAARSFHWDGCPVAKTLTTKREG